jgi:hypothetical protein
MKNYTPIKEEIVLPEELDIYKEVEIEEMFEDDEITLEEEGFMLGYLDNN